MTEDLSQRIADLERERDLLAARVEAYQVSLDVIRDQRAALLARWANRWIWRTVRFDEYRKFAAKNTDFPLFKEKEDL